MALSEKLLALLVCPQCKGELQVSAASELVCKHCRLVYPVRAGVPIMLIDEAQPLEQ